MEFEKARMPNLIRFFMRALARLGVSLGVLGISSAVIYHLFVLDLTGR